MSGHRYDKMEALVMGIVILLVVLIAVSVAITFPLAVIWAINSLFPVHIAYTFLHWLAMVIVMAVIGGIGIGISKK